MRMSEKTDLPEHAGGPGTFSHPNSMRKLLAWVFSCFPSLSFFLCLFLTFIYLFWERERGRVSALAGEGQRERKRERIPSRLHSVSMEPNAGSHSWTVTSWPELRSRVRGLPDWGTQVPLFLFFKTHFVCHHLVLVVCFPFLTLPGIQLRLQQGF